MAAESIGTLIPTAIPGYADAADIQAALRVYHYGEYAYNPANTSPANLVSPSIAKTIYDIQTDITALENRPSSGGDVATTAPVPGDFTPSGIPNGYIWVDQDGTIGGQPVSATSVFTNSVPTSDLSTGVIWVDKDPTSITANPFIPQALISAKGDIVVGTANDTASVLNTASTNGYILAVNSATTSGLEWIANDTGDITAVTSGTGISITSSTGPIPSVAIDTAVVATTNNTLTMSGKTLDSATITGTLTAAATSGTAGQYLESTGTGVQWTTVSGYSAPTLGSTPITSGTTVTTIDGLTLTSPIITGTTKIQQILEKATVSATAATGTVNYDLLTNGAITYYTSNATGNWTLNVRGNGSTTLDSVISTGESLTIAFLVTQSTAYYSTALQIDGNAITPKWQDGEPPAAGNTNSVDIYTYTIIKTGSATFTAFASRTKFA